MNKIHKLPQQLINKIAAGEIIERPAYAVKELIENSIDSHATSIRIDIQKSGMKQIVVSDNGEGMNADDIILSFKPHTTSKILHEDDLFHISSLGFRGEALASMAAISHMIIKSRPYDTHIGTSVEINLGSLEKLLPTGMSNGTQVQISDIFANIPARQKFLTNLQTESRMITDLVTNYALGFTDIAFKLTHNERVVIDLPSHQSLEERLLYIFGSDTFQHLIPIHFEESHIKINGFISKPQLSTPTFQRSQLFVNKRNIKNKIIQQTIKEAYGTLLEPTHFPLCILFFSMPFEMVDINVHPRKEEVHFHNEYELKSTLIQTITKSLVEHNLTYHDKRWQKGSVIYSSQRDSNSLVRDGGSNTYAAEILKKELLPINKKQVDTLKKPYHILQIHNLFLLIESSNGLLLVDQHAAHERILYEKLLKAFHETKTHIYSLPNPISISLSISEIETINQYKHILFQLGFKVEPSRHTVLVLSIPSLFKDRNLSELFHEMLDELHQDATISSIDMRTERMISYLACRSAIKAGDVLKKEQSEKLIDDLFKTDMPYTCPHGRPTQYEISLENLYKMFKRI